MFSWVASSVLIVPKHGLGSVDIPVDAVSAATITLERTSNTQRPGTYGLDWPTGHAIVGRILHDSPNTVTRTLSTRWGRLSAGQKVALDTSVYTGDPMQALGMPFRNVEVPDALGPMPAWFLPGPRTTWVIYVHGIDGSRSGGVRYLPTLKRSATRRC